jgi:hypothetical protein
MWLSELPLNTGQNIGEANVAVLVRELTSIIDLGESFSENLADASQRKLDASRV